MKKQLLLKTLLVAVCLLTGTSAWATTTIYEKGTTGHAWAAADLDDWTHVGGDYTGQEISTGAYLRFYKVNTNNKQMSTLQHIL